MTISAWTRKVGGGGGETYPAWATAPAESNRWKLRVHRWMLGLHPAPVACLFHLGGEVDSVYLAAISVSTRWRNRYQVEASILLNIQTPADSSSQLHSRTRVSWAKTCLCLQSRWNLRRTQNSARRRLPKKVNSYPLPKLYQHCLSSRLAILSLGLLLEYCGSTAALCSLVAVLS